MTRTLRLLACGLLASGATALVALFAYGWSEVSGPYLALVVVFSVACGAGLLVMTADRGR